MAGSKNSRTYFGIIIFILMLVLVLFFYFGEQPVKPVSITNPDPNPVPEIMETAEEVQGYRLQFPDTFNRSLASQDELGISILIALDCSGSMADKLSRSADDTPKYKQALASLSDVAAFFADFYRTNIKNQGIRFKLGLLTFAGKIKVLYPLTDMNEAAFAGLKQVTSDSSLFTPGGRTAIGLTLETGSTILAQSGTIFKSLIIISDGENTEGVEPGEVLTAIVNNRNNKSTKDFPVLTSSILVSFIGFDLEEKVFSSLNTIGSRVMSAYDQEALKTNLKNLFLADIKKLEAE